MPLFYLDKSNHSVYDANEFVCIFCRIFDLLCRAEQSSKCYVSMLEAYFNEDSINKRAIMNIYAETVLSISMSIRRVERSWRLLRSVIADFNQSNIQSHRPVTRIDYADSHRIFHNSIKFDRFLCYAWMLRCLRSLPRHLNFLLSSHFVRVLST